MKTILETDQVSAFYKTMPPLDQAKYVRAKDELRVNGFLNSKFSKKLKGHSNLFELRILTDRNERFFYAYARGDDIWILRGFVKKSEATPQREIEQALRARRYYIGE